MGAKDALKDIYYSMEDKWFNFVDAVSSKAPAFGGFIDTIEEKGVPSFPAAILLVIIIILLLFFFFFSSAQSTLTVVVNDSTGTAVENATITILKGQEIIDSKTTSVTGSYSFLLQNGVYRIKLEKTDYTTETGAEITLAGDRTEDMTLLIEDTTLTKAVYLRSMQGNLITGSGTLTYKCKDDTQEQIATYMNGRFDAKVKSSCDQVEVISVSNYELISQYASFAQDSSVTVRAIELSTGTVMVNLSIKGEAATPSAGLSVRLVPSDGTQPIISISDGTGIIVFNSVPIKTYYIVVSDSQGAFLSYDGSVAGDRKELTQSATIQFNAELIRAVAVKVTITVKDSLAGTLVNGAEVKLTSSTNASEVRTDYTKSTGVVEFTVPQGTEYTVIVDHPAYMVSESISVTAGDTKTIQIEKADPTKANSIIVHVTDPNKMPIDNARVVLKKIDSVDSVVSDKTTGATGEALFVNLELGKSYFAVVSKEGFGSVSSESVQIEPRVQKTLEVTFDIGEGKVILKVLDPEKNPLSGASVKAINQMTSQQEASTVLTSTDGTAEFNIRADKKIYFIVESANYQKYFTTLVNPAANATVNKEIVLYRPSGQLIASIAGIYSGTSVLAGDDAAQISQGVYTVKAIIQVPKGSYTEAGLHLRTGKEVQNVTNNMEEDNVYLSAVNSSGKITKGTSYTPPNGYDIDSKRLTQGDAKWANSVWRNPSEGTYEVESEIVISEADPGVPIELFYRGWAKGASTLRDPKNIATGNELYAMANRRILSSGTSSLCTGSFCRSYTLQTLSGSEAGKKIYVMGTVEAKKGVQYALLADLTNYSGKPISGAVLSVTGKSLDINSVTVNGMVQSAYSSINLGTIGIDAPLKIQVTLSTTSSGTSGIKLAINSSTKNELDETITLNVKQNKKMSFEMVPKVIVPYITNTLFFEAMDNNDPIDGTLVTIKSGKVLLGNVQTTSEGLATYELAEPGIGDVLTITARKEGYDTVELTKAIDTALLTITPDNITETIKKGDVTGFDTTVLIQNNTSTSVKIISTQVTGGLKAYLDVKFDTDPSGAIVERGKDRNYSLSIKLNSAALKLVEPKDVTGNIIFNTTVAGTGQSFLNEVPVDIRISMPGHMDNAKCFKVNPATIDMVASNNEQTKTVTLTNTCAAEGVQIPLQNIEAKLSGELKIGTITLTSTNIKSAVLTDKYAKVSDYLEKEGDEEVTIHFMPNAAVSSGTQTVTILINGKNILDDKTEEKSEAQIKANLTMNILSKCVTIVQPVGGVMLDIAPWSMGYQRIMNSSMAPYTGGYAGFSNQSSPYGLSYMGGMGMTGYGTAGYGNGYNGGLSTYGGYGNAYGAYGAGYGAYGAGSVYSSQLGGATGTVQNMSYDQSSFIIKNTCTGDIDVALEPDPRVVVSEQTFTISADSDKTVVVQPGYVLGRYSIKVNAKPTNTQESKKSLGSVNVTIRRLGDMDPDCIKTNVTNLNLNSFVYRPQTYSVYNTCYDTGVQLSRANVASIECSAPKDQFDLGFYQGRAQSGTGNYYGGQQNNYASGAMMQNACMTNNCSLITGTRIKYRTLEQGATGTTERVDFDVMPSAQYIPQKKLFDNTTGQYGLFQNVSSIRQWATETAARTDVYGTLNVSYSNQYGSGQCQQFPITLTDVWRLTESIDSAINWGDPNARPEECQNKGALDIINYWSVRTGNKDGVVPESEFGLTNKSKYIYIAEPPALRIGPGPTTNTSANYPQGYFQQPQYYNSYNGFTPYAGSGVYAGTMGTQTPYTAGYDYTYYSRIAAENASKEKSKTTDKSTTGTKNCGLLDSIKVLTKVTAEEAGGAVITISETGSGTVLKNTRGSNIMVEIDRSAMTVDCVFLSKPITAKVSRAITMDSQDLTWTLNVLFTREGYTYKGGKDKECLKVGTDIDSDCKTLLRNILAKMGPMGANFTTAQKNAKLAEAITEMEKQNPLCKGKLGLVSAQQIYDDLNALTFGQTGTGLNGCSTNYKDYGFDQIGKTLLKGYSQIELEDCTKNFCSGDMLKAFLTTKFGKIKAQLITLTTPVKSLEMITVKDSSTTLGTTGTSTTIAKLDPVVDNSLTKLYRQALGPAIKLCTGDAKYAWFFKKENGTLLASDYIVPSDYYSENKTILAKPESTNGLAEMLKVTGKIRTAQKEKILIEFPSSTSGSFASKLGMTKLNDKYYMTLARYEGIITSIKSVGACDEKGKDCVITPCGEAVSITISVNEAQALASANGAKFVSGLYEKVDSTGKIIPGSDLNDEEKEKVYAAWPDSLDKIHQLAKYNTKLVDSGLNSGLAGDMKTTMIKDTTIALKQDLLTKLPDAIKSLKIEFKDKSKNEMKTLQIGRYPMEIDFDYSNKDATTATIIVSDLNTVDNAPRAAQNAMLMSGFEPTPTPKETILENSIQGTILGTKVSGNEMLFYKRVPMKLTVELRGGETGFSYRPTDPNFTMPTNLINWHEFGGIVKGLDAFLTSGFFGIKLSPQASAQDIKGIYYYPENGTLMIQPGNTGGSVIAKIMTYKPMTLNAVIPKKNESYSTIQATDIKLIDMTLDNVLKEVIDPNGFACPADGAINWNETKLLSAN